jgi:hypothetical protein
LTNAKPKEKRNIPSPAWAAVIVAALILGWFLLFGPTIIGMADNGDFVRVIDREGLYYQPSGPHDSEYFSYFHRIFTQRQYFNEQSSGIFTSQAIPIRLSLWLNNIFFSTEQYDIRFQGFIYIIYFLCALYFFVLYLTHGMKKGMAAYCVAMMVVLVFGDLAYSAYFNSFYAEGLVMISFVFSMACALLLARGIRSPYAMMALVFINVAILTSSKQQNAPQGIICGLMMIFLPYTAERLEERRAPDLFRQVLRASRPPLSLAEAGEKVYANIREIRTRRYRLFAAGMGLAACFIGVAVYLLIPTKFIHINSYHAMSRGALMVATNPEETLDFFDIDRQYALLAETIYFDRYPVVEVDGETLVENFYSKYSYFSLLAYYAGKPDKFLQLMDIAARSGYEPRPVYAGNYEPDAGKAPGERTNSFNLYTNLKYSLAPRTIGFIILWSALALILSWRSRGQVLVFAACIISGVSQMALSVLTAGDADLSKHVFLYNVAFDFVNCVAYAFVIKSAGAFLGRVIKKARKNKQPGPAAETA